MNGHLEKRYKNSWTIIINAGRDPTTNKRKRIVKSVRGNKKTAEKEMHRLLHELEQGIYIEPSEITLKDYLIRWIDDYGYSNLAPSTLDSYKMIITRHLIPALGAIPLTKLQPMHLQNYYSHALRNGRKDEKGGLSNRTVEYHRRVLREALQHAVKWQILQRNIADAVEPPKRKRTEMMVLDPAGVKKLLTAAKDHKDYNIIFTALYTGMRRGELLALRWQDIDLQARTAKVQQSVQRLPKHGFIFGEPKAGGRRQIALTTEIEDAFRKIKKQQAKNRLLLGQLYQDYDLIFCKDDGSPFDPSVISHRFGSLVKKVGFPGLRFHDLRHTHATLLLSQGVHPKIVQERLGHRSITLTLDTYSHVLPGLQEEAMKKFNIALQDDQDSTQNHLI